MKVKINRVAPDGRGYVATDAWAVVTPEWDIKKIGGRVYYPMFSAPDLATARYFGYYHEDEFIKETPTQELNPEWGPVCP